MTFEQWTSWKFKPLPFARVGYSWFCENVNPISCSSVCKGGPLQCEHAKVCGNLDGNILAIGLDQGLKGWLSGGLSCVFCFLDRCSLKGKTGHSHANSRVFAMTKISSLCWPCREKESTSQTCWSSDQNSGWALGVAEIWVECIAWLRSLFGGKSHEAFGILSRSYWIL